MLTTDVYQHQSSWLGMYTEPGNADTVRAPLPPPTGSPGPLTFLEIIYCRTATVPGLCKASTILPIPKKFGPSKHNHYWPVALISIIMKCLEKLILRILLLVVSPLMVSHQIPYQDRRGMKDAMACLLHFLLLHFETPTNFARLLFINFSSAFNTIQ